jgi:predicted AlkP superfamily phosphohydrolase/phosphomutase
MQTEPSELVAVLFDGVDKIQHLCWRFLDPTSASKLSTEWETRIRESCLRYFRTLDGLIEDIVTLGGAEATVVVASDHGFGPQVRTFFVNAWLQRQGHLSWRNGGAPKASESQELGIGQLARHVHSIDWAGTRAYAPMPSGNGIHIVRSNGNGTPGVSAAEYESFRTRLIDELRALRDPVSGDRIVARVWRREDIFAGPSLELAPDLTLELQDGGLISILESDEVVKQRVEPTGTHRPEGVFIARGTAIRQGVSLPELSILDVAPLLLYSLNLPIPADLDGQLRLEMLDEEAARPALSDDAMKGAVQAGEPMVEPVLDAESEAEILKRLQALGYVE